MAQADLVIDLLSGWGLVLSWGPCGVVRLRVFCVDVKEDVMLDEFLEIDKGLPKGGPRFWWTSVSQQLSDGERDAVLEALSSPSVSDRAVKVWLERRGFEVTVGQVSHLRRKL